MDIVGNMLTIIKNGGNAHKDVVHVPFSQYKTAIAKALLDAGYISGYEKKERKKGGDILEVSLAYNAQGSPKIQEVKRISKPSRRIYTAAKNITLVKNGFGKMFISTPKGILTGEDAYKEHVGGEVLFELW